MLATDGVLGGDTSIIMLQLDLLGRFDVLGCPSISWYCLSREDWMT